MVSPLLIRCTASSALITLCRVDPYRTCMYFSFKTSFCACCRRTNIIFVFSYRYGVLFFCGRPPPIKKGRGWEIIPCALITQQIEKHLCLSTRQNDPSEAPETLNRSKWGHVNKSTVIPNCDNPLVLPATVCRWRGQIMANSRRSPSPEALTQPVTVPARLRNQVANEVPTRSWPGQPEWIISWPDQTSSHVESQLMPVPGPGGPSVTIMHYAQVWCMGSESLPRLLAPWQALTTSVTWVPVAPKSQWH